MNQPTPRILRLLGRLFRDGRGSADMNTYLLLGAAGAVMVALTVPHLFKSGQTATTTFDNQVQKLHSGASPNGR